MSELRNVCLYSAMASQIWRVTALGIMGIQVHVHHSIHSLTRPWRPDLSGGPVDFNLLTRIGDLKCKENPDMHVLWTN